MTAPDPTPANAARLAMRCLTLEIELARLRAENARLRAGLDAVGDELGTGAGEVEG